MRTQILCCLCLLYAATAGAQLNTRDRFPDSVIGWWPENRYDKLKPASDAVSRERTRMLNLFAEWVKKSYTPVGGLGSYQRWIGSDIFGVAFDVWDVSSKPDANGKYKPEGETNITFRIEANTIPGSFPIYFMNRPGQDCYFVWQPDGYASEVQTLERRKGSDPRISPNAYPYITRVNDWQSVFLAPGNKLPFTPVTVEELLQQAEASLPWELEKAKKEEEQRSPGDTKAINDALAYKRTEIDKIRSNIHQLRQRHAGSLHQQAVISAMQPSMLSFETDPDIFDTNNWSGQQPLKQYYPVYKLTSAAVEKAKQAQPLWLSIYFPFQTQASGNRHYEMYRSLTENLNYTYIYNYFFDADKVKGIAYTPLDPAGLVARLNGYRARHQKREAVIAARQTSIPSNAVLYEDFGNDALGARPAAWRISDRDVQTVVTTIEGQAGHWLKAQYNMQIMPVSTKPLPKDFLLEFDIVTDDFEGVTGARWALTLSGINKRAGGVTASSKFFLEVTSGRAEAARANHNYRGIARVRLNNFPSSMPYNDQGGEIAISQQVFTNEKRKTHVAVKKQGDNITVALDGKDLVSAAGLKTRYGNKPCGDCAIPADVEYGKLIFQNMTQDADKVNAYIGNIKVVRL